MEKKNLTITVSGQVNSGKSRLTYLLKEILREKGFEVEFDGGIDFEDEKQFNENTSRHIDEILEAIKDKSKITFKEVQVNRCINYGVHQDQDIKAAKNVMHKGLENALSDLKEIKSILEERLRQKEDWMNQQRGRDFEEYCRREVIYREDENHEKLKRVNQKIENFIDII